MTAPTLEKYDADTGPDDFLQADEPPEPEAPEGVSAGDDAGEGDAPYGWTRDRETGQLRPKRRPGRPKTPPGADEVTAGPPVARAEDRPPGTPHRPRFGGLGLGHTTLGPPAEDVPMPKGGVIAAGVNKAYRRAGKILRAFDRDLGEAFIACTKREEGDDADELTVGEGWENLCKVNPRVRRWVTRAIASGAVGDLIMAHAPIGIAFMMKPLVQKLLPFDRLIASMAEPDDDTPEGEGSADTGGMTADDFEQMRTLAEQQARRMAERMGMNVTAEDMAAASAQAAEKLPPAFRRQQAPRGQSRAKRRSGAR